ncbi:hypothetical protein CsSME_00016595 [Camellia sinensis var. sinensis]
MQIKLGNVISMPIQILVAKVGTNSSALRNSFLCTHFIFWVQVLVNQIDLYGKLNGHAGCVNTVQFNSTGDLLVSGSDDRQVMFWNWAMKKLEFSYPSGHLDNIFQVRIMPFTDDRKIVTSSADGQVFSLHSFRHSLQHAFIYLWNIF